MKNLILPNETSEAVLNLSCDDLEERKGPKNRPKHTRKRIHQAKKNFLEKFKTASQSLKPQRAKDSKKTKSVPVKSQHKI